MISMLNVEGLTGRSGAKYVKVSYEDASVCIPLLRISNDRAGSKAALITNGIIVLSDSDWRKFVQKVGGLREFRSAHVIEKVGWNRGVFALPDGTVISAQQHEPAYLAIEARPLKCSVSGSFDKWHSKVATRLAGQHLATFVLMSAFMPPLLNLVDRFGNFGFEIVGPKGTGKSTLQFLVASALGGVGQDAGGHYWVTLDTTYNALEDTMREHSDLPIIMDEANLLAADAPPKERAAIFKALAFKLGSGSLKGRYGTPVETDYRLGFIISNNEPLASVLGQSTDAARAAADRLITLPIDASRPFGIFDALPADCQSSSHLAQKLIRAARRHHGQAIRKFLQGLVNERAEDEASLRRKIKRYIMGFRNRAGVDPNDGSAVRVAEAFGLVYAAGRLAQSYGVLPEDLNVKAASLRTYRLHSKHANGHFASFGTRLANLLTDERVIKLKKGAQAPEAIAYITKRSDKVELLIPRANIEKVFPDWANIRLSRDVATYLQRDGQHQKVKRSIGGKKPVRVYCFVVRKTLVPKPYESE